MKSFETEVVGKAKSNVLTNEPTNNYTIISLYQIVTTMPILDQTPENKELRSQSEQLRIEFALLVEKRNYMLYYEEALLTSLYLTTIGNLQFRIFTLKGDLAILNEKIRQGQIFFNRNQLPDWKIIDKEVKKEFHTYLNKVAEEASRLSAAKELLKSDFLTEEEEKQLKEIYRILVKRLHPDINPDQSEKERELYIGMQAAYQQCNIQAMNDILIYLNGLSEKPASLSTDLVQQVDHLKAINNDLQLKIDKLNDSFPFNYRSLLTDEEWIESQKSVFGEQTATLEKEINKKNEYLLLLQSWKPELLQ